MKDKRILFCKRHSMRLSYYNNYNIIITEGDNEAPVCLKGISDIIPLDIFMKYCLWKY